VLNVVATAIIVALGIPWWVNGIFGVIVIAVILWYLRNESVVKGTRFTDMEHLTANTAREKDEVVMPSSVRLAKFERIVPTPEAAVETIQKQDAKAVKA
jgi:hypothetical protein